MDFNDEEKEICAKAMLDWSNDMGGTNILEPLKAAQLLPANGRKKRIFLLTDGNVDNGE